MPRKSFILATSSMPNSFGLLLPFHVSSIYTTVPIHAVAAQRERIIRDPSSSAIIPTATLAALPTLASSNSQGQLSTSSTQNQTLSQNKIIDAPPLNIHLSNKCLLWNSSCSRNKSLALEEIFGNQGDVIGTMQLLEEFLYFFNDWSNCTLYESAEMLSEFILLKIWMRSPQCVSSQVEFMSMQGDPPIEHALGQVLLWHLL